MIPILKRIKGLTCVKTGTTLWRFHFKDKTRKGNWKSCSSRELEILQLGLQKVMSFETHKLDLSCGYSE